MDTKSTCELCGNEIDLSTEGWMESDTGDVCAECVNDAASADERAEQLHQHCYYH